MPRRLLLLVALIAHCGSAIPQPPMYAPIQSAQANPAPEPPPPPPKKPATASPTEETGMAGQVAQEGVVLPTAGAVSASALVIGLGAVIAAGVALSSNNDDSNPAATTTTR